MSTFGFNVTHIMLGRSHFVELREPNLRHVNSIQDNIIINIKIVFDNPYCINLYTKPGFQNTYSYNVRNAVLYTYVENRGVFLV